ncbi:MAG: hypothetical protein ACQEXB_24260 [Bacillota bacterium]
MDHKQPFVYNDIFYNEVIYWLEAQWQRKLTDHERNVLVEGYRFGRLIEAEKPYHASQELREFYAAFSEAENEMQRGINYGIKQTLNLLGIKFEGVND